MGRHPKVGCGLVLNGSRNVILDEENKTQNTSSARVMCFEFRDESLYLFMLTKG